MGVSRASLRLASSQPYKVALEFVRLVTDIYNRLRSNGGFQLFSIGDSIFVINAGADVGGFAGPIIQSAINALEYACFAIDTTPHEKLVRPCHQ